VKRLADQTLYEILEVALDAPPSEIEAAYERARALYAPGSLATYTLMTPEEATLLTSRIEDAKRTLLDPDARTRYDASLSGPEAGEVRAACIVVNFAEGAIHDDMDRDAELAP
jgi:DnaJ-class molecular chaperone